MNLSITQKQIIEAGRELAKLDASSKALRNAREWWAAGCHSVYSNQDIDILTGLQQAIQSYKQGYRAGLAGAEVKPSDAACESFLVGYDAGECDRPTLDELEPLDVAKERGAWYL